MRILMTNWVYLPEFSGAALQSHRLAKELTRLGVQVQMLTGTHEKGLMGVDTVDDILVHRVLRDKVSLAGQLRYWATLNRYIRRHARRFDLVHTHGFHPRVNLAARRAGLPIVQKITNQTLDDPRSVLERRFGHWKFKLYNMADAVIPTSKVLEDLCRATSLPQDKIIRIPNGVDTELFSPAFSADRTALRDELHAAKNKVILLTVGTVNYTKGLDTLLKAIYELDDSIKQKIRLWVVGPMSNRDSAGKVQTGFEEYVDKVKRMIDEFGLQTIVQFRGRQSNVHDYMRAADLYIHPSRREGQPNAILEAMAAGLPVVANLLPGITDEILQAGRYGYLVNAEDKSQFAAALRVLINNDVLRQRLGHQGRVHVEKYFSLKTIAQRYVSLYSSIIHKGVFDQLKTISHAKQRAFKKGATHDIR